MLKEDRLKNLTNWKEGDSPVEPYLENRDGNVYLAAADIWEEKAATIASQYDFSADGASLSRSQQYRHACQMAARMRTLNGPRVGRLTQ